MQPTCQSITFRTHITILFDVSRVSVAYVIVSITREIVWTCRISFSLIPTFNLPGIVLVFSSVMCSWRWPTPVSRRNKWQLSWLTHLLSSSMVSVYVLLVGVGHTNDKKKNGSCHKSDQCPFQVTKGISNTRCFENQIVFWGLPPSFDGVHNISLFVLFFYLKSMQNS